MRHILSYSLQLRPVLCRYLCFSVYFHLSAVHLELASFRAYDLLHQFQFHAGKNVGLGKDHTIFSLIDGLVKFEKFGPDRKKVNMRDSNPYKLVPQRTRHSMT